MYKDDFELQSNFNEVDDLKRTARNLSCCIKDLKPILQSFESDSAFELLMNIDVFTSKLEALIEDSGFYFSNLMPIFAFSYYFLVDLAGLDIPTEDFKLQVSRIKNILYIFFNNIFEIDSSCTYPDTTVKQMMN